LSLIFFINTYMHWGLDFLKNNKRVDCMEIEQKEACDLVF
jgi:hypothetical protein